jgi:hypothetical protein
MPKLIQITPMPETATSAGCLWGLTDEGEVWVFESGKWHKFYSQPDLTPSSTK